MTTELLTLLTALGVSIEPASGIIFDQMVGGEFQCASCKGIADPVAMGIPGVCLCEPCAEDAPHIMIGVGRNFDDFRTLIKGHRTWRILHEETTERGILFVLARIYHKPYDGETISHPLVLPSDGCVAIVRERLGLPADHAVEIIQTPDGPCVLLVGEVLIEWEPASLDAPWALTAQGGTPAARMPTAYGLNPASAISRLIVAVGKFYKENP